MYIFYKLFLKYFIHLGQFQMQISVRISEFLDPSAQYALFNKFSHNWWEESQIEFFTEPGTELIFQTFVINQNILAG